MRVVPPDAPPAGRPLTEMEFRVAAASATLARFKDIPFEWGRRDCAKMGAFHARKMGCPVKVLAKAGSYFTAMGAGRALKRLGYDNLPALVDAHFPQVAPAAAWVGDFLELRSDSPLGCIAIYLGNGVVIAYEDAMPGAVTGRLEEVPLRAWRVRG